MNTTNNNRKQYNLFYMIKEDLKRDRKPTFISFLKHLMTDSIFRSVIAFRIGIILFGCLL